LANKKGNSVHLLVETEPVSNYFQSHFDKCNEGGDANRFALRNDPYHLLENSISALTFNPSPTVSHFFVTACVAYAAALFANRLVTCPPRLYGKSR
jgi:hypothetical protein